MSESHQSNPQVAHDEAQNYKAYEAATVDLRKKLKRKIQQQRAQYQLTCAVFNLLAIAQIIIGAAITALGPSGGEHILAITILGAFNTSIAGLLALLKGRGLPQRLRGNMAELSKVLDFINERAILLRYGSSPVSNSETSRLLQDSFQKYTIAQQIIERNEPDTYANGNMSKAPVAVTEVDGFLSPTAATTKKSGKNRETDEELGTSGEPE